MHVLLERALVAEGIMPCRVLLHKEIVETFGWAVAGN